MFSKRDAAADLPPQSRAPERLGARRGAAVTEMPRRSYVAAEDGVDAFDGEGDLPSPARRPGVRLSFRAGLLPKTVWGRILLGGGLLLLLAAGVAGTLVTRGFLLRDEHFLVESSSAIQIDGNSHMTRAQLLSVFGGDVERNIFSIPLGERRAELERLPWVAHATVMRLLPNRVRVAIVERTPVAFVRQGPEIGLVDAKGVLLDMAAPADDASGRGAEHDSFPVLTGISAADPLSVRAARMKIYLDFVHALDASGENISARLSEVDLSNPEDVKAVVADSGDAGILVYFGQEKFLERYRRYEQHLAEWKAQYPRLASVDMRYERQVVLQMQPGPAGPDGAASPASPARTSTAKPAAAPLEKPAPKAKAAASPPSPPPANALNAAPVHHLTTAFAVPSKISSVPSSANRPGRKIPPPPQGAPR